MHLNKHVKLPIVQSTFVIHKTHSLTFKCLVSN